MCVRNEVRKNRVKQRAIQLAGLMMLVLPGIRGYSQDGNAGLEQANQMVRGYFETGTALIYAIGAIIGLVGGIKVYQKWSGGHPDTGSTAAAWFGACVFLVVVATVIRSFFGI